MQNLNPTSNTVLNDNIFIDLGLDLLPLDLLPLDLLPLDRYLNEYLDVQFEFSPAYLPPIIL